MTEVRPREDYQG